MSRQPQPEKYFVSRQMYWPAGDLAVEVSLGSDSAGPDMLVEKYKSLGEGKEFADPREAVEAAILVRRKWAKDVKKRIVLSFGDADFGWEPRRQADLLRWAEKRYEQAPKCDECGKILGKERYGLHYDPDSVFCSEYCAEKAEERQRKLNEEEAEPNVAKRKAVGLIGDVNYLEYGGMLIFDDETAELIEVDEEDENAPVVIYRFDLDRVADPASEWFGDDLKRVAATVGTTAAQLAAQLASADLGERASAYRDLVSYFGPHEFDSDPLSLSPQEAEERYRSVDRQLKAVEARANPKLLSTQDSPRVEKIVRRAAAAHFGRGQAVPFFEHDQWWVDVDGQFYSVVDHVPGVGGTGLSFERID
jgi:hypothetical protein